MSWLSLFARARKPRSRHTSLKRQRTQPGFELLEDRCVPATFAVTTLLDLPLTGENLATGQLPNSGNLITLRSAISAANATSGANTINLALPGIYQLTLTGANEDLNQSGDLDILPPPTSTAGSSLAITNTSGGNVAVDAAGIDRAFDINPANVNVPLTGTGGPGFTVSFTGFTIENGRAVSPDPSADGPAGSGGGIRDTGNVSLTLTNALITDNSATNDGGGVSMENVVSTKWTLKVVNSTISNNHAGDAGGGIDTDGHGHTIVTNSTISGNSTTNQGAGIWLDAIQNGPVFESSSLTVTGSTLIGNITMNAGGVGGAIGQAGDGNPAGAGGINPTGVVITSSTIADNTTQGQGGGYGDQNGGSPLLVVNSTFANNISQDNGGGIEAAGTTTTIEDSTVTQNLLQGTGASLGGGLFITSTTFVLTNTVVAGNFSNGPVAGGQFLTGMAPDLSGNPTTSGGDFIGIADANTNITTTNLSQVGTTAAPLFPRLGPLQNNGGQTLTMLPLLGSPLVDKGVNALLPTVDPITGLALTDQRGALRVTGGTVDIGAAEFQNPATTIALTVTVNNNNTTTATFGQAVTLTATVTATGTAQNNPVTGTVTFLDGTTVLGTATITNGVATLTTKALSQGTQQVTAQYSGDGNFTANTVTITVAVIAQTTVGVFDPTTGTWYLRNENSQGGPDAGQFAFGGKNWYGLTGDWLGNGQMTIAAVDPTTPGGLTWYIHFSNSAGGYDLKFQFGGNNTIPIAGDWNGTGHFGIGVYDPTTATFYLRNEVSGGGADAGQFVYGAPHWIPVIGDWTHSGKFGVGVVDPTTETWYLRNTANAGGVSFTPFLFGAPGWKPVVGDWDGNGTWTPGVFDPSGKWYLRNENSAGGVDFSVFPYGQGTWTPLAGQWSPPPSMHLAAAGGEGAGAASISTGQLEEAVQGALQRLAAAGVNQAVLGRLASATVVLQSLTPGLLGQADPEANTIALSADGAGHGWFVDATPLQDEEFSNGAALPGSAATGREDLLTAVLHEMGHLVGLPDDSGSALMAGSLAAGTRSLSALNAVFAG